MAETKEIKKTARELSKFEKGRIIRANKYVRYIDILEIILDDDKMYSFADVDKELEKALKKEVK
ncbi:hypothetical protein [Peptostreptococcus faecalis]|uniref:hypothetical protein n=1 Tax=Peptostreptococcus faecalis TaxID=2045015 RepID=UPI000C7A6246|nr:hypothetical protein [Peptostreptococcus faecalis]